MTKLIVLTALAMLAIGGCKSESARKADNAAEKVQDQRKAVVDHASQAWKEGGELVKAQSEFETRRAIRIDALRAEHTLIATQPVLINATAQNFALTDDGRANVDAKLHEFQLRLDETKNLIEGLEDVDASVWTERDEAAGDAMTTLEAARNAAWAALQDAPRVERPAS